MHDRVEYVALRGIVGLLAALPLSLALRVAEAVTLLVYWLAVPIRRVGAQRRAELSAQACGGIG